VRIALVLNTRRGDDERQVEYDPPHTVELITRGIEAAGHDCTVLEADETIAERLVRARPKLVFNRSEGIRGESRESHVPAILEMLGIPYVGSGVLTLALCLNKAWTNVFLSAHAVRTPAHTVIVTLADLDRPTPGFPVILKPVAEGSSIGINEENVVADRTAFLQQAGRMLSTYNQPILVEQFVPGREVSVGMLEIPGGGFEVLPPVEVAFDRLPSSVGNVFGQRAKTTYEELDNYLCPAPLDQPLASELEAAALTVCRTLAIRDFARLDFRIDPEGRVYFLEINPLPGMDFDLEAKDFSFFTLMAMRGGYTYDRLIARLLDSACRRHGLT
jgi:D-alanine-D-alanine ligase